MPTFYKVAHKQVRAALNNGHQWRWVRDWPSLCPNLWHFWGLKFVSFKHAGSISICLPWGAASTRHFVLRVPLFKDVLGPGKNAVLSSGVGSDDDHPCPVVVGACWSWSTSSLFFFLSFFFTAVRRCTPGVRCCSDRCGYDRGMGSKAPGDIDLWVIWCSLRLKVRDAWLVQLNIIQPSEDEPWTVQPATSNFRVVWSHNEC